jgi:2-polyprenyl-3-methyl-5-hydroxy-6-metoxy-1,4-benzoquinol methylase
MAWKKHPVIKAARELMRSLRGKHKHVPPPYVHVPEHTVVADFAEFSGLPMPEIERRMNRFHELARTEWDALPAADFTGRAKSFYASSQAYIFDLLNVNLSPAVIAAKLEKFHPGLLAEIRKHPGRDFLEFGGGTGVFCEIVHGLGKHVTYLDIDGLPMRFATWRFAKYKLPITVHQATPGQTVLPGTYDLLFTDAVLEHLPVPEQESVTRALAAALRPGGMLIFVVDLGGDEDFVMHAEVDIRRMHVLLAEGGLACRSGRDGFFSIWTRA